MLCIRVAFYFFVEVCRDEILLCTVICLSLIAKPRELKKHKDNDRNNGHDGDNLPDKEPDPFRCTSKNAPDCGDVVGRHLHNKWGGLFFFENSAGQDFGHGKHHQKRYGGNEEHGQALVPDEINVDQKHIERDLCQAV